MNGIDKFEIKRLKIGIFGKQGSGKSALINALLGVNADDISKTTETIYKAMDIKGLGSVTLVDTVGIDSEVKQMKKTQEIAEELNVALMLIANESMELELAWINRLTRAGTIVIPIVSRIDMIDDEGKNLAAAIKEVTGKNVIRLSAKQKIGLDNLRKEMINLVRK